MLADIENLLKQTLGLDAASIGSTAVERAVHERLAVCRVKDGEAYLQYVRSSPDELQELIEAVVVPETWFFRDREAFVSMVSYAKDVVNDHPARLLSLPCATGEEAYTMAIALLDAGIPPNRFSIDAVDISLRALERARDAVYGRNSFRGHDLGFRGRHFESAGKEYRLAEEVRQQVRLHQGNIFAPDFLPGSEIYDVIFCRNMLIYFDRETQDRAIQVLLRLLAPKGLLFVGPAETGLMLTHPVTSTKVSMAFAFRKGVAVREIKKAPAAAPALRPAQVAPRIVTPVKKAQPTAPRPVPAPAEPARTPEIDLDEAAVLADQGQLVEAANRCEEYLRVCGPSAQAFHLLGLVRDAVGKHEEAAGFYRKALYLDPQHHESLLHLSLLLDRQGDKAGAKVLSDRARRLIEKEKP